MKFRAISFEQLDDDTIEQIRIWRNQDFVRTKMFHSTLISAEEHRNYISSLKKNTNKGLYVFYLDDLPFAVYQYEIYPEGNYVINGSYLIQEDSAILGYGAVMSYYINEIAFLELHVNKCFGQCLDTNKTAIRTNKRLGGELEGVLRQHILIGDQYHDVYCFGLLKDEWEIIKPKIKRILQELSITDDFDNQTGF